MPIAITKAYKAAQKSMVEVDLNNGTIYHDVTRKSKSSVVYMRPASPGTGVIAGGAMRAIFEAAGVEDILAKCVTTSNAINVVRATWML